MPSLPDPRETFNYYVNVQEDYQAMMSGLLLRASRDLERDIKKAGKGVTISEKIGADQMRAVKRAIDGELREFNKTNRQLLESFVGDAAEAASNAFGNYEAMLLQNVMTKKAVNEYLASAAQTARAGIEAAKQRVMGKSYIPLSTAIYGTENLMSGMVDKYLETALARGWSARDIAAGVKSMMSPNTPGGLSYAAMRLGRTEINNAFHAMSTDRYEKSPYVKGVDWHLSGSHPEGDECDDLAEGGPYKKDEIPEKPHPQCFCYITPELISEDEFLDMILGPDGDSGTDVDYPTIGYDEISQDMLSGYMSPDMIRALGIRERDWRMATDDGRTAMLLQSDFFSERMVKSISKNMLDGKDLWAGVEIPEHWADTFKVVSQYVQHEFDTGKMKLTAEEFSRLFAMTDADLKKQLEVAARKTLSIPVTQNDVLFKGLRMSEGWESSFAVGSEHEVFLSSFSNVQAVAERYATKDAISRPYKGPKVVIVVENALGREVLGNPNPGFPHESLVSGVLRVDSIEKKGQISYVYATQLP